MEVQNFTAAPDGDLRARIFADYSLTGLKKVDQPNGSTTFVGLAPHGSADSDAVWQIYRERTIGNITTREFVNNGAFDQVWEDRASLFAGAGATNNYSTVFDGTNDQIGFGNNHNYDNATQWSLTGWVRPNNLSTQSTIWAKASNDVNVFGWGVYIDTSGQLFIQVRAFLQLRSHTSGVGFSALNWTFFAMTYDGGQNMNGLNVYFDGVHDSVASSAAITNTLLHTDPSQFARRNSSFPFPGHMDEMAFWGVELDSSEVMEAYNAGSPPDLSDHSQAGNLQHWYRMGDGDTAPTITDNVGTVDGTMENFVTPAAGFVEVVP